jgi:hypothetical protein
VKRTNVGLRGNRNNPNPLGHRQGQQLFEGDVSRQRRLAIIERDGGCCLVWGSTIHLEVDQRIALMNGGDNKDANLGTLCDSCHVEKTRYDWADKKRGRSSIRTLTNENYELRPLSLSAFLHESIGGIRPDPDAPGYKHFQLKPHLTRQLDWAKASVESPYGLIRSEWKNEADLFQWKIEIPPNTSATIHFPNNRESETVESGKYEYTIKLR